MIERNHYEVLGVTRTAQRAEIRRAYIRLARHHHPDAVGRLPGRLHQVQEAYRCLSDNEARARHDEVIAADGRKHGARRRSAQRRLARFDRAHPRPSAEPRFLPPPRDLGPTGSRRARLLWLAGLLLVAGLLF